MVANTLQSDINEILLGFYLNGGAWFDADAKRHHDQRRKKIPKDAYNQQGAKAAAMAAAVLTWAASNDYRLPVKQVWWTARPGVLATAVGREVDSRKNPTDILVKFTKGPANGFLGISAKSTKTKGDIAFKNPGMGTIEQSLGINLHQYPDIAVAAAIKKYKLAESSAVRKQQIRASKTIQTTTVKMGQNVLQQIRDAFFERLKGMKNDELREYLTSNWLDSGGDLYPPYIKVTGMGTKPPFSAKVSDPLKNEKAGYLMTEKINLLKVGNDSVGVTTSGGHRILKMRAKYESEKLASTVKFSGDPY